MNVVGPPPIESLTRRQCISHSGFQEGIRTRRGLQPMVAPLVMAAPKVGALATPGWCFLEAPTRLKIRKKGRRVPVYGLRYRNLLENDYSGIPMPCRRQAHDG